MKNQNMKNGSVFTIVLLLVVILGALFIFISNNNPETVKKIKSGILSKSEEIANEIKDPIVLAKMKISDAENVYKNLVTDVSLKKEKLKEEQKKLQSLIKRYNDKLQLIKSKKIKLDQETYNNMITEKKLIEDKKNYINFLKEAIQRETKLIKSLKTKLAQMYMQFNILQDKVDMAKAESGYNKITESDFNKMTNNVFNFTLKDLIKEQDTALIKNKSNIKANQDLKEIKRNIEGKYSSTPNLKDLNL